MKQPQPLRNVWLQKARAKNSKFVQLYKLVIGECYQEATAFYSALVQSLLEEEMAKPVIEDEAYMRGSDWVNSLKEIEAEDEIALGNVINEKYEIVSIGRYLPPIFMQSDC